MGREEEIRAKVEELWVQHNVEKTLEEYISIPNQSPMFDPEWATNGLLVKAAQLLANWVNNLNHPDIHAELLTPADKTPLIFIEVKTTIPDETEEHAKDHTILLYGHMDKQPPLTDDWSNGLHPYTPIYRDGKLYGRGGADDGYSIFGAVISILALKQLNIPHPRCVVVIEGSEESGSIHLMEYVKLLSDRIGDVRLVVCLDSGCGNYDQLWLTTSLRGLVAGVLTVEILKEGMHSGRGSGVVPSTFRIIRQLLSRVEDVNTGEIILPELHADIPSYRLDQAKEVANELGAEYISDCQLVNNAETVSSDIYELVVGRTWKPTLSVTGVSGIPSLEMAGNVLRPQTSLMLSFRTPPTVSTVKAAAALKAELERDPPYGAKVTFQVNKCGNGWDSPNLHDWLSKAVEESSSAFWNRPPRYTGEGGSIPFMGMLAEIYPRSQFIITGVLGPFSNAHGPNEFLHLATARRVTCSVAHIVSTCSSNFTD